MSNVTRGHGVLEGFLARKRCAMANALIPPAARSGRILDVGCGSSPYFLTHTDFAERFGIDQVMTPETAAQYRGQGLHLSPATPASLSRLDFEDNTFDVVTMLAVFEHIDHGPLVNLLREIRRVLKPGGCYIATTPAAWSDGILRVMARTGLVSSEEIDEHKDAYTHAKIAAILQEAGFAPGECEAGYFECFLNLWVRARKP